MASAEVATVPGEEWSDGHGGRDEDLRSRPAVSKGRFLEVFKWLPKGTFVSPGSGFISSKYTNPLVKQRFFW